MIQKVDFFCAIDPCKKKCPTELPKQPAITFLEASRVVPRAGIGERLFDTWQARCQKDWCGILRHDGEVKFFCERNTGDLRKDRMWTKGGKKGVLMKKGHCSVSAGQELVLGPIGDKKPLPKWWTKTWPEQKMEPSAKRWGQLTFDCCRPEPCSADKRFCKADGHPRKK